MAVAAVLGGAGCHGGARIDDLSCSEVVEVSSDETLQTALAAGFSDTCIILRNGIYSTAVQVGAGVRLVGESREHAVVQANVTLIGGEDTLLRDLEAQAVVIQGTTGVRLESVTLAKSYDAALLLEQGSQVVGEDLLIDSPALYGVYASAGTTLTLDDVTITGSRGPGVWATCGRENCCDGGAIGPTVILRNTTINSAHLAGVAAFGSEVTLEKVTIAGTLVGPQGTGYAGEGGGGFTAAQCSNVNAKGLHITKSEMYGMLFDASTGTLGGFDGISISDNDKVGLWVQNPPAGDPSEHWITIENASIVNNKGVGLGVAGGGDPLAEKGMIICNVMIEGTASRPMPVKINGFPDSEDVGDGLLWRNHANIWALDVTVSGSARQAVLIDGIVPEPNGASASIVLGSGNTNNSVLQQNVPAGQELKSISGLTPQSSEMFSVAHDLTAPSAIAQ